MTQPADHALPHPDQRRATAPRFRPWQRWLAGVVGVAATVGALWLTLLAVFIIGVNLDPACDQNPARGSIPYFGATILVTAVAWTAVCSLLKVAICGRGVAGRTWIKVAIGAGVLGLVAVTGFIELADYSHPVPGGCFEMS